MPDEVEVKKAALQMRDAVVAVNQANNSAESGVVTHYLTLIETTGFTDDGDTWTRFMLHWPTEGTISFTMGLGLLARAKRSILSSLADLDDDDE